MYNLIDTEALYTLDLDVWLILALYTDDFSESAILEEVILASLRNVDIVFSCSICAFFVATVNQFFSIWAKIS